jgi:hypothetical protein
VEIQLLLWRRHNLDKLAEHHISQAEVDGLVDRNAWVSYVHPDYPDQVRIVGPTPAGRWLTIALDPTDDPAVWRPVTGWNATSGEREYHREEYR